jgi:hypothetical protein
MQQSLNNTSPQTFYIQFGELMPKTFKLFNSQKQCYYFRFLDGKTKRIRFNIPDADVYKANVPFEIVKKVPIELPVSYPELPPAQRDRMKDVEIIFNPSLNGTPARIFSQTGKIEISKKFLSYPPPIRLFLLLHEQGHLIYRDEIYCDLWAMINFLRLGYNQSTAFYSLSNVLSTSAENVSRLREMFKNIQKTQKTKL